MRAGILDNNDKKDFKVFRNDLTAMRDEIKGHIKNEETYVHPFLRERVPGAAQNLERPQGHRKNARRTRKPLRRHNG